MATPYVRTLRSLDRDSSWVWSVWVAGVSLSFGVWALWLVFASVGVYEESLDARVISGAGPHAVQAEAAGRITQIHMFVGQRVEAGAALLEMEAQDSRLLLSEARSREDALYRRIGILREKLDAERSSTRQLQLSWDAVHQEAEARLRQAEASVTLAEAEAERARQLHEGGLLPDSELQRALSEESQSKWNMNAEAAALERFGWDHQSRASDRRAKIQSLLGELATVEGELTGMRSEIQLLERGVTRRVLRAPIAGVVGEHEALTPGALIDVGDPVATIIPGGTMKIVAEFNPATAMGRIRKGQRAVVRLEGFPWVQHGVARARVASVALESRGNRTRVELEPMQAQDDGPTLVHGLAATVEVEVERLSPADLLLRTVGIKLATGR